MRRHRALAVIAASLIVFASQAGGQQRVHRIGVLAPTEDPERILDEVEAGMRGKPHERQVDRRRAIARALELARPGDTVLLAGKGHETYQVIGTEKQHFDEREVVHELGAS